MYYYTITFRSPGGSISELYVWADSEALAVEAGDYIYEGWTVVSTERTK